MANDVKYPTVADPSNPYGFGEPGYIRTYNPEAAQAELEARRNAILHGIAEKRQSEWQQTLGPGGYEKFAAPIQQVAQQRVSVPMQTAAAYSQSAGIGGPAGPAFPGMADLPALQSQIQGFTNYMNMLTGPMAQQLLFLDEEALQDWYNKIGREQLTDVELSLRRGPQ
jgi:hypothetical protein|tara:strand:+ start:16644 stop:17147 length:504 start_codon:yes stop_codon:yes gene_type:complete